MIKGDIHEFFGIHKKNKEKTIIYSFGKYMLFIHNHTNGGYGYKKEK